MHDKLLRKEIKFNALKNGTVEKNLLCLGVSKSICKNLRKKMGLIKTIKNGKNVDLRIVDNIKKDQSFTIVLEDELVREIPKFDFSIDIIFEDDFLAVINKPQNLAVISTHEHYGKSLENALANAWGQFIYRPVNRLDRDTSGLMIVAKNQFAHSVISKNIIEKKYKALVVGKVENNQMIDVPIDRQKESSVLRTVGKNGKPSKTYLNVIKNYQNFTLCEFTLYTGRTHQIRVHSKHIGHPICCDPFYNPNQTSIIAPNGKTFNRQTLHSSYLKFKHPYTKAIMEFNSEPPFLK